MNLATLLVLAWFAAGLPSSPPAERPVPAAPVSLNAPCGGALGPNIVPDGDFGAGPGNLRPDDPGYVPGYTYAATPPPGPGAYTITNNTTTWTGVSADWIDTGDNSDDPNGYMLVVHLIDDPGIVFERTIEVCPNTVYEFSADLLNLFAPGALPLRPPPDISFLIDGATAFESGDLPADSTWRTFPFTFTTQPGQTSLVLALRNNTPGGAGIGLALDNLALRACGPEVTLAEVDARPRCPGDTLQVRLTVGPELVDPLVLYEISTDSGASWQAVDGPTDALSFSLDALPAGARLRARVAGSPAAVESAGCYVLSNELAPAFRPIGECYSLPVDTVATTVCDGSSGPNIFPDGDFGSGADQYGPPPEDGVIPSYEYVSGDWPDDGQYTLVNTLDVDPCDGFFPVPCWIPFGDNSDDPNGYTLVVNASPEPGIFYQRTITGLCEETVYTLSADVLNVNSPAFAPNNPNSPDVYTLPNIDFLIAAAGVKPELLRVLPPVFNTGEVLNDSTWHTYAFTFRTGPGVESLTFALRNNVPGGAANIGNDLALDNIALRACNAPVALSEPGARPRCAGEPLVLVAQADSTARLQWQQSTDDGQSWENAGPPRSGPSDTLRVDPLPAGARYRVLSAATEAGLTNPLCYTTSDELTVAYRPGEECETGPIIVVGDLCTGQTGANLAPNGDFGADSLQFGPPLEPGFTTYAYAGADTFPQDGQYTIANRLEVDPCLGFFPTPCWIPVTGNSPDPDDSLGYAMIVNAAFEPGIFYTTAITGLCENTIYQFSADILNISAKFFYPFTPESPDSITPPNLDFIVARAGTPIDELQTLPPSFSTGDILNDSTWNTYGFTFRLQPGVSDLVIAIRNNAPGGPGNDLAIDNVTVAVCGPVSVVERPAICPGDGVTLTASLTGDQFADPALQWFSSADSGATFVLLPGETGRTLTLSEPRAGDLYGFFVANDPVSLQNPNCRINSSVDTIGFLPAPVLTIDTTLCAGERITIGANTYSQSGAFTERFQTGAGCDSLVVLNLLVLDPIETTLTQTICKGESVVIGDQTFTETGTYRVPLRSAAGCDSTVVLSLTALERFETDQEIVLCPGETYNGLRPARDTVLVDSLLSAGGCDSLVRTTLRLSEAAVTIGGNTAICGGEAAVLDAGDFAAYQWSTGAATPTIEVQEAGTYSVTVTDALGCQAGASVDVAVQDLRAELDTVPPDCLGNDNGRITVLSVTGGSGDYRFALNDGAFGPGEAFGALPPGEYRLRVRDEATGCSYEETVALVRPPTIGLDLGADLTINRGDSVRLSPRIDNPGLIDIIEWRPATGLSCTDCPEPVATPSETTTYTLTLRDTAGCDAVDSVLVRVNVEARLFVPNAFSPNGDGTNERFTLYGGNLVLRIERLLIFDRWGGKVFETGAFAPGDEAAGWDGTVRGRAAAQGVYVFLAEVTYTDESTEIVKGEVVLVR